MKVLKRVTEGPGPRSRALHERRKKYVSQSIFNETPLFLARARGALLEDVDGNEYIDFVGGVGALNVGHGSPRVIAALKQQADQFVHVSFQIMMYEPFIDLMEKLTEVTPGKFAKKGMFANSGAEAIENAVKVARAYTRRPAVVVFEGAFHGRTLLAMTLTSSHPRSSVFRRWGQPVG